MKPTIKGPPGGPLPTCPSCGAKLEYLKVVQLNSPFSCPNCRAELCVPRLYGLLGVWLSLANSVLLSIAIGLRGLYLLLGVLLMFLPVDVVTAFLRRHSSPPRLTIYRADVSLQAPVLKHQLAMEAKRIAFTVVWSLIAVVALVWVEHVPWVTHWSGTTWFVLLLVLISFVVQVIRRHGSER